MNQEYLIYHKYHEFGNAFKMQVYAKVCHALYEKRWEFEMRCTKRNEHIIIY